MRISVALCTYNGESYLEHQLESIARQTRKPDELVVCDDQSNPVTKKILKDFAARACFPVRLFFNQVNLGTFKNFEQAIELCTGDVIALSDQDDVWHPHKLSRLASVFSAKPKVGLAFSDAEVVMHDLRPAAFNLWERTFCPQDQKLFKAGKAFEVLLKRNVVTGATMAFRSQFKELILPITETVYRYHDGWIALMIAAAAEVEFIPEPLILYRQHDEQLVGLRPQPNSKTKPRLSYDGLHSLVSRDYNYSHDITQLDIYFKRLFSRRGAFDCRRSLLWLENLINHYQARDQMPLKRMERIQVILHELKSRNYFYYSKGFRSILKDLLC
ncbi:MAG TPA: glycosyltransferase family 2 protein [Pyrinomonadaceae bacterium]|jgi:glycosyltransferase involved in cell wall biosynthesis|nr:glycosyltransferase family 2 protein [Pyrinomonadaceae bacterium]